MILLSELKNSHRPKKKVQRVGRGVGSGRGKTSCRGAKGDKARRGYGRNFGREGGGMPLYRKLPVRGFSNARFQKEVFAINLDDIEKLFSDGEIVSLATLREKGLATRRAVGGLKILGGGILTKKVSIEARALSAAAKEKLEKQQIAVTVLT